MKYLCTLFVVVFFLACSVKQAIYPADSYLPGTYVCAKDASDTLKVGPVTTRYRLASLRGVYHHLSRVRTPYQGDSEFTAKVNYQILYKIDVEHPPKEEIDYSKDFWQIALFEFCPPDSGHVHSGCFALFFVDSTKKVFLTSNPSVHPPFRHLFGLPEDTTLGDYIKVSDSY